MVSLEVSTFEVTLTKGTDITDQPLATVGGAIQGLTIKKIQRSEQDTIYQIIVIHDATGTTALELTKRQVPITLGATDILDQVLATTAGATEGVDIEFLERNGDVLTYDVMIVHLNA